MDIASYNGEAWDAYVDKKDRWTIPVSAAELAAVKSGEWKVVLTPQKPVPHEWFPELQGANVLGLASGGGQQGPILAALGAQLTIFDNSAKQLQQDKTISDEFGLNIQTIQGDMRDLSVFADNSFDLIFNPCSLLFVDDVAAVWRECYRVLKPNGILMTGLINPLAFQVDSTTMKIKYKYPYADLHSLSASDLADLKQRKEALSFGHSLTDQIGGQLQAGFLITDMYEDDWGGENPVDPFFPSFLATRAIKHSL